MLAPLVIELHAIECGPTDLEIRVYHSAVSPQEHFRNKTCIFPGFVVV